jgi:hypothetical protein
MDASTPLPIAGARLYVIASKPPEALLILERHGGTLVSGDSLQNWARPDEQFSWLGNVLMRMMGFIKPHHVGPGWLKQCQPPKEQLRGILELPFVNVMTGHGDVVIGEAREKYRPAIERVS